MLYTQIMHTVMDREKNSKLLVLLVQDLGDIQRQQFCAKLDTHKQHLLYLQAAELPLELLIPRHQQKGEHVVDAGRFLWHT